MGRRGYVVLLRFLLVMANSTGIAIAMAMNTAIILYASVFLVTVIVSVVVFVFWTV